MTLFLKRTLFCLAFVFFASTLAFAQEYKVKTSFLTNIPGTFTIEVEFTEPIGRNAISDINKNAIKVTAMPSGQPLLPISARLQQGSFRTVLVELDPSQLPGANDTEVTICFKRLRFVDRTDNSKPLVERLNVCDTAKNEDEALTRTRLGNLIKEINEVPKSSDEKNIFASGFTTKGSGNDAEGGAELKLNSNDLGIPGLTANLHMLKSTAENADPKRFDVGLTYSSILLFHRRELADIRDLQNSENIELAQSKLNKLKHALWSSITFDFGSRFEAQALTFDVANFVGEGLAQIKSRILPLRRLKDNESNGDRAGFYKFHLIPFGVEAGQNLNNGNENINGSAMPPSATDSGEVESVDWLARYKFGGGFTLFYKDPNSRWLFKRVELDAQFVGRYLFRKEVMFDQETMRNISTTKGYKPWTQVDLKAYVADTPSGRFGLKLGYKKGSLPPVFAATNSFQFGFVYETADDAKKQ